MFGIWIAAPDVALDTTDWPVMHGHANDAITRFPLANGETVWLIRVSVSLAAADRARMNSLVAAQASQLASAMGASPGDVIAGSTILEFDDQHDDRRAAASKWIEAPFDFTPGSPWSSVITTPWSPRSD